MSTSLGLKELAGYGSHTPLPSLRQFCWPINVLRLASVQVTLTLSPRRARNFDLQIVFVYTLAPALAQSVCDGVIAAASSGLTHRIAGVVPLPELARAHREAESQTGSGHMIVSIP